MPEVHLRAVLLATMSTMVVGSIWYTPKVFGTYWMRIAKVTLPTETKDAIPALVTTLIVSAVSAWVLAMAIAVVYAFRGGAFLVVSLATGVLLWAGFTAARFITHDAFEGRPVALTVLNCAHELVTIAVMSLIIGFLAPRIPHCPSRQSDAAYSPERRNTSVSRLAAATTAPACKRPG